MTPPSPTSMQVVALVQAMSIMSGLEACQLVPPLVVL